LRKIRIRRGPVCQPHPPLKRVHRCLITVLTTRGHTAVPPSVDLHRRGLTGHLLRLIHRHPYRCIRVEEKPSFATRSPLRSCSVLLPCTAASLLLTRDVKDHRVNHRSNRPCVFSLTSPSGAPTSSCQPPSNAQREPMQSLCSSSRAEHVALLLAATVDEPCRRASSAWSSCAAGATPSSSTGRLRRVDKVVVPGRVSEAATVSMGAPALPDTSSHGTAPPTPPRAPPVLQTSLRATSQSPPPPDDALHVVPLWPTAYRHGAHSTVSFPSLHRLKSDSRAVDMHLGHFPHPLSPPVTGISQRRHRPCAMATAPCFQFGPASFGP
jgi:hypothetical protein